eukprot:scaffold61190_cov60-Attheya_sp.AAC.1
MVPHLQFPLPIMIMIDTILLPHAAMTLVWRFYNRFTPSSSVHIVTNADRSFIKWKVCILPLFFDACLITSYLDGIAFIIWKIMGFHSSAMIAFDESRYGGKVVVIVGAAGSHYSIGIKYGSTLNRRIWMSISTDHDSRKGFL